jgi:ABC-type polysaccharide/polyol phosphate export systems, permease component
VRGVWRRRQFTFELSRTTLRSSHFDTVFGQLWLVINPLLLAAVYFLLVEILRQRSGGAPFFAHLMAGCSCSTSSPARSTRAPSRWWVEDG